MGWATTRSYPSWARCSKAWGKLHTSSPRAARARRMVGLVKARTNRAWGSSARRASSTAAMLRRASATLVPKLTQTNAVFMAFPPAPQPGWGKIW